MITKELLTDIIHYIAMTEPIDYVLEYNDTVTYRGDAHGLFERKIKVVDNRFHPILTAINGWESASDCVDKPVVKRINTIYGKDKKEFINFIDKNYKK